MVAPQASQGELGVATSQLPAQVVADTRHHGTAALRPRDRVPLPLSGRADPHAMDGSRVNQPPNDKGLWRAGCGGTRTSGSEVRAGETDRPRGRHRAPARPYALSWLSCWRRLQVRWDRDAGRWFAFVLVACALVCFNRL